MLHRVSEGGHMVGRHWATEWKEESTEGQSCMREKAGSREKGRVKLKERPVRGQVQGYQLSLTLHRLLKNSSPHLPTLKASALVRQTSPIYNLWMDEGIRWTLLWKESTSEGCVRVCVEMCVVCVCVWMGGRLAYAHLPLWMCTGMCPMTYCHAVLMCCCCYSLSWIFCLLVNLSWLNPNQGCSHEGSWM